MLTLISGMFGLLGPLLPDLLGGIKNFFQDKSDKKHELAMVNQGKNLDNISKGIEADSAKDRLDQGKLLAGLKADQANVASARAHDTASQDVMARLLEASKGHKTFGFVLVLFALAQFLIVTVRPLLAHAVTIFWGITKIAQAKAVFLSTEDVFIAIQGAWTEDDYAIFALILGFYFGDKIKKRISK